MNKGSAKNTNVQQIAEGSAIKDNIVQGSSAGSTSDRSPTRKNSYVQHSITPDRIQIISDMYKNIRILQRFQTHVNKEREEDNQYTNERTGDNDASSGKYLLYIIKQLWYFFFLLI